jgi:hypothetical protein
MFMPKRALSVTLDEANLLWLKGRAAAGKRRSLSDALDQVLTQARQGGRGAEAPRSVVGTIDIAAIDPSLDHADAHVQSLFDKSLSRPFQVRDRADRPIVSPRTSSTRRPQRG